MAQPVKYYYNLLSQPCRALFMFLEASKIPYEPIVVNLRKGEHLTEEYKNNVNRFQKVPVINDRGFKLAESVAIFRYLVREKLVPDHWYPRDSILRARVDEYLEWQHNNIRMHGSNYFQRKYLFPLITRTPPNAAIIEKCEERLDKCLNDFEEHWARSNEYLVGSKITFADLLAICEVDQPKTIGYDPFEGRPKLASWYQLVKDSMSPYYEAATEDINKLSLEVKKPKVSMKL